MNEYKEAIERSTIPRIPYKSILGMSLTKYILVNKYTPNDELIHNILLAIRSKQHLVPLWNWENIISNVKISISARRAEHKLYGN